MSNRIFKLRLNNKQSIMFDYGIVNVLPQITNIDLQKSAICCFENSFFIKSSNENFWKPIVLHKILNVFIGTQENDQENVQENSQEYIFVNNFDIIVDDLNDDSSESSDQTQIGEKNIMIWTHGCGKADIKLSFKCLDSVSNKYKQCFLPYLILSENIVAIDCNGFQNQRLEITIS